MLSALWMRIVIKFEEEANTCFETDRKRGNNCERKETLASYLLLSPPLEVFVLDYSNLAVF